MLDYDKEVIKFLEPCQGLYRRYSDDILVICPTEVEEEVQRSIIELIATFGLIIQPAKTQKTRLVDGTLVKGEKPVNYLGFQFDGKRKRFAVIKYI